MNSEEKEENMKGGSGCSMEDESKRPTRGSVWILNIQGSILLWK